MNGQPHNRKVNRIIAVIGAGPAGITAAAAASAGGAKVVLVESTRRLGGSVTAAMHRSICGLYADTPKDALDTLNDSWQRTVVERMVQHSPDAVRPRQFGKAWVLEFPPAAWEFSLDSILSDGKIERRMATRVAAVRREGDHISSIELEGDHPGQLEPEILIDCTGGGSVLQLIGEDVMLPADDPAARMLRGYGVRMAGITGHLELLRLQIPYALAKAVQAGELPAVARFTVFYPGPGEGEGVCKLALPADEPSSAIVDNEHAREPALAEPRDASSAACGFAASPANPPRETASGKQQTARTRTGSPATFVDAVIAILQRDVSGFATAKVIERSPRILPRDGRRLRGRFVLSEDDVLAARKHGDDAVRAWWPIERWDPAEGPQYAYPPVGDHYDISPDTLRSEKIDNLLAAGNAISATAGAAASSRASGICLATGTMAGKLAAELTRRLHR